MTATDQYVGELDAGNESDVPDPNQLYVIKNIDRRPVKSGPLEGVVHVYQTVSGGLPVLCRKGDRFFTNSEELSPGCAEPIPAGVAGVFWRGDALFAGIGDGKAVQLPRSLRTITTSHERQQKVLKIIHRLAVLGDGDLATDFDELSDDEKVSLRVGSALIIELFDALNS